MENTAVSSDQDQRLDYLAQLAAIPWQFAELCYQWQTAWLRSQSVMCLFPAFPPHPHEPADQLEIPDPIEVAGEHLFA